MTFLANSNSILQISHAKTFKRGILGASAIILSKDIDKYAFLCVVQIFMKQTLRINGKSSLIYRISHMSLLLTPIHSAKRCVKFFKSNSISRIQCTFRCKCFDVSKITFYAPTFSRSIFWLLNTCWLNISWIEKCVKVVLLLQKGFEPILHQWKGKKKLSQRHVTMIFRRVQNTFQAAQKLSNSKVDSGEFVMLSKFQRLAKKCCFFLP